MVVRIDINTSGLPGRDIFAWILRYQLKITKADEYWRKMTNMRVIEHRWLLNNTKNTGQQSTSWANTLIFRPSLITLFKAELAVQMYICQWLCAHWLVIEFTQQEIEKAWEKLFSDFFTLKVFFYVKTKAKMLNSAGLNVLNFVFWILGEPKVETSLFTKNLALHLKL